MSTIVDLTHPLRTTDAVYPGDPPLRLRTHATIAADGYRLTEVTLGSHHGTHVDAPSHYLADGATADQLPLGALVGAARVIDVPGHPLARITPRELEPWGAVIGPGSRILLRTRWDARYNTPSYYSDHPGLSREAAAWLSERRVALLGFDTPSPSHDTQAVHEILLGPPAPCVIVESMANLGRLPAEVWLAVLPLAIAGTDGAPARAIAVVDDDARGARVT